MPCLDTLELEPVVMNVVAALVVELIPLSASILEIVYVCNPCVLNGTLAGCVGFRFSLNDYLEPDQFFCLINGFLLLTSLCFRFLD